MQDVCHDRLELALKASNEGIWDWIISDNGSGELYYSERNLEFLGATKEHAPNVFLEPDKWFYDEDVEKFKSALDAVYEENGEDLFAVDCRYCRGDGALVWLRIRGAAVRDDAGKLTRMAGSMIDISRRKNAEAELEEERHRLLTLIENIPVNVYFKDVDSRFVMANTATAVKLGEENVAGILGKSDADFFDSRHADKSRSAEELIMTTGEEQSESLEQETWEGKDDTWVITSKMPWQDSQGRVKGIFGVTHDVTSLVRTQRQLMDLTYQLKTQNEVIEEELQLAHEIQLSMIKEDQITCFPAEEIEASRRANFAYRYAPVTGMAGDFFQVIPLDEGKVGIFMCDVMGHGVRSALIVSMLRGLMEKARDSADSPEWFIYDLNQGLVSILQRAGITMFATAFYAVLDLENKSISYANAGHPSPMVLAKGGEVKRLSDFKKVIGPALGLVEECAYASGKIDFSDVEKLILFTDGLYETEDSEGEQMGFDRLKDALLASDDSIDNNLDDLLAATRKFAGDGEFDDDVCLLGVQL